MCLYLRATLWETGGYFTEKRVEKPSREWTHLALVYHVIAVPSMRLSLFVLYVNGELALRDTTKKPQDSEPSDGRIVLGRPYSEVDDYYTSMEVEDLVFYNSATDPEEIKTLYETGGVYPE